MGGAVIAVFERGVDWYAFWNTTLYWVTPRDFLTGITKSVFFGGLVTVIGCYNGLASTAAPRGSGVRRPRPSCRSRRASSSPISS